MVCFVLLCGRAAGPLSSEACVLLCAISYLWHAFVEESDPGNQYVNSVTILGGHYNVWNEDRIRLGGPSGG